jgi:hypothetical protein
MLNICKIGRPVADIINKDADTEPIRLYVNDKDVKTTNKNHNKFFNELQLGSDEYFQPIANPNSDRFVIYISGPQGSGKSYWIGQFLKHWKKEKGNGKKDIYLFSLKDKDSSLDVLKPKRLKLDEKLKELDFKDFKDSTLIFDDIDSISDKNIKNIVYALLDNVVNVGRSYNINCIATNHAPTDGRFTRAVVNSADMVVYFPMSGSAHGINYLLNKYVGLTREDISNIKKLKSRSVCIYKNYPQLVSTEKNFFVLAEKE